jgi:sulfoquinovose isomerase
MSEPGSAEWRRAEAGRLITFGRGAALGDGGFGWLDARGGIDESRPAPLYLSARLTYVFALAHLDGEAGAGALAAAGLRTLAGRYADPADGGWFSGVDLAGRVTDATKANYDHAHTLLAAASAAAAGIPGAEPALFAAAAAIEQHSPRPGGGRRSTAASSTGKAGAGGPS